MVEEKREKGYCINCDNKHGCKSGVPPCIGEMVKDKVSGIRGKEYLIKKHRTHRCMDCDFFRSCWNIEDYKRLTHEI